ncbi:MAG TPA: hypothetical protein VGM52_04565 [Herbaspirillum sp.]|jgi:hypothetical protein
MSNIYKSWFRAFCAFLLVAVMASVAQQSKAMLPKAGLPIGTKATITYRDASNVKQKRESDVVLTRIDQVYQVEILAMRKPAHAEIGEDADIPFQVTNVGNGTDDVTLNISSFPKNIDNVTFFNADAGGTPQLGTGVRSNRNNPAPFTLKGIDPDDDRRYFVLRMPLPKSAKKDDEFHAKLDVSTKGGKSGSITADALAIDQGPFSVAPVGKAKLNGKKQAWVQFRVNGGVAPKRGYFQVWAVKSSDVSTPLKYIVDKRASFDGNTLRKGEFDSTDDTLFKLVHEVGANGSYLIKMPIEVIDAERGDEIVVFVKYGEAEQSGIRPISDEASLEKSTGFVIAFDHIEGSPDLKVIGNSRNGKNLDFTIIDKAISGETVDYDLVLFNRSTFADTFVIEELTEGKGNLIAAVTPMDSEGRDAIPIGFRRLPETESIPANGTLNFKISIRLRDGRVSNLAQNVQIRIKSVGATSVDPITQIFTISKVVAGGVPTVAFSDIEDISNITNEIHLANGGDIGKFYLRIKNPENLKNIKGIDTTTHEYQMQFVESGFTIQSYSEHSCGAAVTHTGPVGEDGKVFCVVADLSGISRLKSELVVTDSIRSTQARATMTIVKSPDIAFASTGYDSDAAPGDDAALTIRIVNRGGDMTSAQYELWHDGTDTAAATTKWPTIFSFDDKTWGSSLTLPGMIGGGAKDVFVKISIPKDTVVNRTWSLTLGLREIGDNTSKATTVITLSLDESGLIVVKEIAIVKSAPPTNCAATSPVKFAKTTKEKVKEGDCIWYRISVTNLPAAATVRDVSISDPIPKHSDYTGGAKTNQTEATLSTTDGKIVTKGIDLKSDTSLILTYPVTVNFKK